ncbi:MAG: M48 family metallopeptidase [Ignavibacteria bacterium]
MEENRKITAKRYEKIKLRVSISESIISLLLILIFVYSGISKKLEIYLISYTSNPYFLLILFLVVIGIISQVLSFPFDYFFGFRLEHKFSLSNQTFSKWIIEGLKSLAVGVVLGVPILLLFFWILRTFEFWWFWFGCVILIYSVVLAQVAPVLIFPLFYKFKPLENENLKNKILDLCTKVGFKIKGVFSFDMSKTTKKANAAFTGMGKTKRIILADTLIAGFSEEEIETVFAHELGHYKKGHIKKTISFSIISTFIGLFIISILYKKILALSGFASISDISVLPLFAVIAGVIGFLSSPLGSYISRKFEFEADKFAVITTGNFEAFKSAMEKLAFQNLTDDEPNKFVEFWFHSHPSIKRRIEAAGKIDNLSFSAMT